MHTGRVTDGSIVYLKYQAPQSIVTVLDLSMGLTNPEVWGLTNPEGVKPRRGINPSGLYQRTCIQEAKTALALM